mmetsp:Transcript_24231/g.63259  ORF Transcript_24231/g.63259 Transcript_24231/m.63259 type:complete len:318 (+) Transcript_24231:692-1645(+)
MNAHVEVDSPRAARQMNTANKANQTARTELTNADETPHTMNTIVSDISAATSKKWLVVSSPASSSNCDPYILNIMPAHKFEMMPDSPMPSARANMNHALPAMYSVSGTVLPGSLAQRRRNIKTHEVTCPRAHDPNRSFNTWSAMWYAVKFPPSFKALKRTMATASFTTDSPNIIVCNSGCDTSSPSFARVLSVATGSTAEMRAANAKFERTSSTMWNSYAPRVLKQSPTKNVAISVPRTAKIAMCSIWDMKFMWFRVHPLEKMITGSKPRFRNREVALIYQAVEITPSEIMTRSMNPPMHETRMVHALMGTAARGLH